VSSGHHLPPQSTYLGDVTTARQILHDSLRLWLDLKNNVFLARIYGYLAEVALAAGDKKFTILGTG